MHWQNSSWIMGLRIYEEGRTQISLNSPTTIDPLAQITEQTGSILCKNANNTKINQTMILTLSRMGFSGAAHGWGGEVGKKAPAP